MSVVSIGTRLRLESLSPMAQRPSPHFLSPLQSYLQAHSTQPLRGESRGPTGSPNRAGDTLGDQRAWVGVLRGDPAVPPLPRAAGNAAGAAQWSPCRMQAAEMQSPSRRRCAVSPGPRPHPYLWPTSLPTEPPPRAGSRGLSPCGSSGAEAPAGAPPGPVLPSDGERGSLARAILRERTAAAAARGGGGARRYHLGTAPRPPRVAAAVERARGGWRRRCWKAQGRRPRSPTPRRRGRGRPGSLPSPPERPRAQRMPQVGGGRSAPRGCVGTE